MSGILATELWHVDADLAERLWSEGFRPREARLLAAGQTAAVARTMFGVPTGGIGYVTILAVELHDDCPEVVVRHIDGTTEADALDEVWAR